MRHTDDDPLGMMAGLRAIQNSGRKAPRKEPTMKRASYRHAVAWIALNDEAGAHDSAQGISGYVTTLLVADLFGLDPERVGRDVYNYRKRNGGNV